VDYGAAAPVANASRQRFAEAKGLISFTQPEQTPIAAQAARVERRAQRQPSDQPKLETPSGKMCHGCTARSGEMDTLRNRAASRLFPT
jgi:hypothetical protein